MPRSPNGDGIIGTPKTPSLRSKPSQCLMCYRRANTRHYGVSACRTCRTFFRRSILTMRQLRCMEKDECTQTPEYWLDLENAQRSDQCSLCRLKRLIALGMNPNEIKPGKGKQLSDYPNYANLRRNHQRIVHQPQPMEHQQEKLMLDLIAMENAHHAMRVSTYSPQLVPELSLDVFISGRSRLGKQFGKMSAQAYEPVSIRLVPVEFAIKHRMRVDFSDFDYATRKLWVFQNTIYSIEFIKALSIYSELDCNSKRILLASALTCSHFTNAFYSYCQDSDRTCFPDGSVMSWSDEIHEQSPDSTRFHTEIIAAIRETQLDKREYVLLKIIIVCNSMLDGLCSNDVALIQHERERYAKTLLSYVLIRRGDKEVLTIRVRNPILLSLHFTHSPTGRVDERGPAYFARIMSLIDVVNRLTSWHKSQHILILAMGLHKHRIPFVETVFHSH